MFKNTVDRRNSNSAKWDECITETGKQGIIPLTVADMDFRTAPEITQALIQAVNHGIYGYTNVSKTFIGGIKNWVKTHYHWHTEAEWIVFAPRVIQAVSLLIQNYTEQHDQVLILSPLYAPIQNAVLLNDRTLVTCPLCLRDSHYGIDFDDFEQKISAGCKVLIMCSPHNPVGRVWTKQEIEKIVGLCKKYQVLLIADEVHADFVWQRTFVSFGSFFDEYSRMVICTSPAKTFNIPGAEASGIIIKDASLRELFQRSLQKAGIHNPNYFCVPAVEAAYTYGDEWLQLVKKEIWANMNFAADFFEKEVPDFRVIPPEGTYMLWVDYRAHTLSEKEMEERLIQQGEIAFSMGSSFGTEGEGFFRVNTALPHHLLQEVLSNRFKTLFSRTKELMR